MQRTARTANAHGHMRTTADVDILIRREDLDRFKERYLGLGWVNKFEGSKNFRDSVCNVNIDALIVGDYPGDGLPEPVIFPAPETVAEISSEGIPYVSLVALIELKLASGMTAPDRPLNTGPVPVFRFQQGSGLYIATKSMH